MSGRAIRELRGGEPCPLLGESLLKQVRVLTEQSQKREDEWVPIWKTIETIGLDNWKEVNAKSMEYRSERVAAADKEVDAAVAKASEERAKLERLAKLSNMTENGIRSILSKEASIQQILSRIIVAPTRDSTTSALRTMVVDEGMLKHPDIFKHIQSEVPEKMRIHVMDRNKHSVPVEICLPCLAEDLLNMPNVKAAFPTATRVVFLGEIVSVVPKKAAHENSVQVI